MARLGTVVSVSSLYETAPIGGPDQGPFLNAVAVVDTGLDAAALLQGCLAIERSRGRERRERWGPRTLDLDLLLFGDSVIDQSDLTVPHPRMGERRFVVEPLAEAWPAAPLPGVSGPADLMDGLADQSVVRVSGPGWWRSDTSAVLVTPPARVSPTEAAAVAAEIYGLEGAAQALEGERDRNFLLVTDGGRFSLKIANPAQDPLLLDLQQEALGHLAGADPGLAVPRPVRTTGGELVGFTVIDGATVPVRMQTYLPGDRLPDGYSTPESRDSLAGLLARLDAALAGFSHPGGNRPDLWDLTQLTALRPRTVHLTGMRREMIESELDHFDAATLPALGSLRWQMIHSDANPANLLTQSRNPDDLIGIIDFGDLVNGPLVADLAVAAAYQCLGQSDPAEVVTDLTRRYHLRLPLSTGEIGVIPGLVAARFAQSLTISAWRADLHPENRDYILIHAEPGWDALQRLRSLADGWLVRGLAG